MTQPGETGLRARLYRRLRRSYTANRFMTAAFQRWYSLPVEATHFYSPLPDIPGVKARLSRWYREGGFPGIDWRLDEQRALLRDLAAYGPEFDRLPGFAQVTADGYGMGYGEVEAALLYAMVRRLRPRRIVEVGSGVSTYYALAGLRANRSDGGAAGAMECIEPYPRPRLSELAATGDITLSPVEVQDVAAERFDILQSGDVLFIDSSHVSKVDSDVNWLCLEIVPRLAAGVVIHFHDIPFPHPTCPPGHPLFNLFLLWNEAPLVQALLTHSSAFEILMCQSYLHARCPDALRQAVRCYDPTRHFPVSLWLSRKA